jgi:hypothetical protein
MINGKMLRGVINPKNIKESDITKVVLEKADFHTDEGYFDLVYRCYAKDGLEWLVEFPRVVNVFPVNVLPTLHSDWTGPVSYDITMPIGSANLLLGELTYLPNNKTNTPVAMASCIINEPSKEMTLSEVEKELGYKVKIISEKENSNE